MKFLTNTISCLTLTAIVTASPARRTTPTSTAAFDWDDTNFVLAFGDSYTFVQGVLGYPGYSFIGDFLNFAFTPTQLLSNEIVKGVTSAGGPNWVEYLTGCFSGLPAKCTKQLWNFAFAGSDVSTELTPLHHPYTISFENQVTQWNEYARPVLPVDVSKALVVSFIGINDINDSSKYTFPRNNASNYNQFYDLIIDAEMKALEPVYAAGYRNFLFVKLPPLDKTPAGLKAGEANARPNVTMIQNYNHALGRRAGWFAADHPGTNSMVFDTYSYLSKILKHPLDYGIKNTTDFCRSYAAPDITTNYTAYGCLPINEYFWYNSGHITYRVHELLAGGIDTFLRSQKKA